ncbi:flavodoxin domain-containing protein [Rhodococcus chondri]|uniref:Flavodoxin domain-containing protein n=1 Tax=Rhodococcus chondri TaxID=3065941 RepID=A0ABU7JN51_9NOCA|nr:flavodoxin domain-containing protein [Rhodococcus sp. CC-R104]MEE2031473.1 flavodoxin domain-containing protein [Rhodococcus sp. CC-R104]
MKTLVAYATAHGSTRGVAERIAAQRKNSGDTVESMPVDEFVDPSAYDAVIIGSAVHNGQWLPEAVSAIERCRTRLAGKAVWTFSVSSIGASSAIVSPAIARLLRKVTPEPEAVEILRTVADMRGHRFFAGAIAPGDWPGKGKIVFRLMGGKYGDARDWQDIDSWASSIR